MKWVGIIFLLLGVLKIGGILLLVIQGNHDREVSWMLMKVFWGVLLIGMSYFMLKQASLDNGNDTSAGRSRRS